ncbi:hypothetical protein AAFF_G00027850 [Aldrovandia affinis]|uniref:Uncharacterized protein n=1 Tax=Aldrovandia affinis TaxID=143900 RepID=A0AAD7S560_9TELE|nr:hypothetical protein AAFF_G00027850 [Aldrovandia affinis]
MTEDNATTNYTPVFMPPFLPGEYGRSEVQSCRQEPSETVLEFALRLEELFHKLAKRDPDGIPNSDRLLREQFIDDPARSRRTVVDQGLVLSQGQSLCALIGQRIQLQQQLHLVRDIGSKAMSVRSHFSGGSRAWSMPTTDRVCWHRGYTMHMKKDCPCAMEESPA